ncbi:hypothetical protein D3C75_1254020 [compost metagenome]
MRYPTTGSQNASRNLVIRRIVPTVIGEIFKTAVAKIIKNVFTTPDKAESPMPANR